MVLITCTGTATQQDIDNLHVDVGKIELKFNQFSKENHVYMEGVAANITAYSQNLSRVVSSGFKTLQAEIEIAKNRSAQINQAEIVFSDVFNILILNQHIQTAVDLMDKVGADCRYQKEFICKL